MNQSVVDQLRCSSCGAPPGDQGTDDSIVCQFCGVSMPRPLPEAAPLAEIAEPSEPDWLELWREELEQLESKQSMRVIRLLASIFLVLIPGLTLCIGGSIAFGVNGSETLAILSGVGGFLIAACGVLAIVFSGISLSRAKRLIREKRARLQEHASL